MNRSAKTNCFLILLLGAGCAASAQTDRLFGYTGKRINDTVLQTPSGSRVTYSPARGLLRINSSGTAGGVGVVRRHLKSREAYKKKVLQLLTSGPNGRLNIHLANRALSTIDEVDRSMEAATAPLPPMELSAGGVLKYPRTGGVPPEIQGLYDEVVSYVASVKEQEKRDPPPPPPLPVDYCFPCDEARKAQYSKQLSDYQQQLAGNHAAALAKGLKVLQYFEHARFKRLPYDSATASIMEPVMIDHTNYLSRYMHALAERAYQKYKDDITLLPALITLLVGSERQLQLNGGEPSGEGALAASSRQITEAATAYLERAAREHNYPLLLNVSWVVGLMRQAALTGGEESAGLQVLGAYLEKNRFLMTIDADVEMGEDEAAMQVKLTGENMYRAVPDSQCKLQWYLHDREDQRMQFQLQSVAMPGATYKGTFEWTSAAAKMELGFCEQPERDTLIVPTFIPKGKEIWVLDANGQSYPVDGVSSILIAAFLSEERMKNAAQNLAKIQELQKEMTATYTKSFAGYEALMRKDPATMTAAERKQLQELLTASQKIQQMTAQAGMLAGSQFLIRAQLKNGLPLVLDGALDGKQLSPRNTSIRHARFSVKLEHQ